jgi:hypothetical protein
MKDDEMESVCRVHLGDEYGDKDWSIYLKGVAYLEALTLRYTEIYNNVMTYLDLLHAECGGVQGRSVAQFQQYYFQFYIENS